VHYIRFFLIGNKALSLLPGLAGLHGSKDLDVLAIGVDLL